MNGITREEWVGRGRIDPAEPAIAGEYGSWTVRYAAGAPGIDDGGHIRLAYRSSSDWAAPQFVDPALPNYVSVDSSRPVRLTPTFGRDGIRPWTKAITVLVSEGSLYPGDIVTIVLGDRTGGSPGMRAQTYPERPYRFSLQVDPIRTGVYEEVTKLEIPLIGGCATQLVVTCPSDVVDSEPSWLQVRALDAWGNPDPSYRGTIQFDDERPEGCPAEYRFTEADAGVHLFEDVYYRTTNAVSVVSVCDSELGGASSNPIRCHAETPQRRLYWADLHGQTGETGAAGSIEEYLDYARNVSALDATSHSGNDFDIPNDVYEHLCTRLDAAYEPGQFVTFTGYEWSGNTPGGGDRNVYYFGDGPIRRSSHALIEDKSDIDTDCFPVDELYRANAGREDVILTPHIGGRPAILDYHDSSLEPAIEIASQWGRFEWFAIDALSRGMRVALIGGSDDHSCRPGWSWATLSSNGTRGGLTAFLAEELTRLSIWEAFKARRCYGTSGPRIVLDVTVNDYPMGSEPSLKQPPTVKVRVLGTAPVDTVEVRRGTETVYHYEALPSPEPDDPLRVRFAWRGARNRGRTKALDWTGVASVWNGRIVGAQSYAIDNAVEGVSGWDSSHVRWKSHTCGDWDGVILDLEGNDETRLDIDTPTMRLSCSVAELECGALIVDGPNLEQQIVVRRLAQREGPREVEFSWTDERPQPGWNPYWIWVTQADGELAWSTPVYVQWNGE